MKRIVLIFAVSVAAIFVTFAIARTEPQASSANLRQSEIADLQNLRIELLEQRVSKIRELVAQKRIGVVELARPEMDVINARLDYVQSGAERKVLLAELLAKYDKLIEMAKFAATQPIGPNSESVETTLAEPDLLLLKSERVRTQILHELMD